ncbi:MAG: response regulator, partial [Deltaproteobacteria bacterium]|nr:response regulator [Deltaproteobacteria bacterium]
MSTPLRVLVLEDYEDDALLLVRHLGQGGFAPDYIRVDSAAAMQQALSDREWDIIISDFNMPGFSALAALEIYKQHGLDIPFIIISGTVGEERAVAALKAGAHDFVIKDNLARLLPAIERELREAQIRQGKKQSDEANQAKSLFLANMSHEIRTPLNGIIGLNELMLNSELNRQQRTYAETLRSSAASLLTIINDILDFSKIEAGKLELELIDFDLRTVLEDINDSLALRTHNKGLSYSCSIEHSVPSFLHGDPGRLRQILVNLIGNAIKFTDTGRISVKVCTKDTTATRADLLISVEDTGPGIPPDQIARLFNTFSQLDASTTRNFGGTGLGLAISKQLAEMMGGDILVESSEGQGSTFCFSAALALQDPPPNEYVFPEKIQKTSFLIIDSDAESGSALKEQLLFLSCRRVTVAGSTGDAMTMLAEAAKQGTPFQVIFLNNSISEYVSFAQKLAALPGYEKTIWILTTTLGEKEDTVLYDQPGFSGFLVKPYKHYLVQDCLIDQLCPDLRAEIIPPREKMQPQHLAARERNRFKILLAEDNETNQMVAQGLLKASGYQVDTVISGREALQALEKTDYDLVLMD